MRTDNIQRPLSVLLSAVFFLMLGIAQALGAPVPGSDVTYTSDADFDNGTLMNLNHNNVHDQLQLNQMTTPFPFINISNSGRGTLVRIDVNTGAILGEYYSSPDGMERNPSRTTVDQFGNVWVANRDESGVSGGVNKGSITRVGLIIGGTRANADGSANPTGQYLKPPFQYNTCIDRDGDGLIKTSRAANNMLSWSNAGGADTHGGVSTAEDECIINYTRVVATNTRTIAIDANNDVWVGGLNTAHEKVSGLTGEPVPGTQFNLGCGGYGGLIDKNGVLWSARFGSGLLRYDTKTMSGACLGSNKGDYGLGMDPNTGEIWHVFLEGNRVAKLAADGTLLGIYNHGDYYAQGVVVDKSGNVWVAHSVLGPSSSVGHLRTDGTFVGNVSVGSGPTGVSVDANGKVWSSNYYSWNASRINPNAGAVGGAGFKIGAVDMTVSLGSNAYPYNYSDMTGYVAIGGTSPQGSWTVVQDSGVAGNMWGTIIWNKESQGSMPSGTIILVEARAADTEAGLSSKDFIAVSNSQGFSLTGRYIEARVTLKPNNSGDKPVLSDLRISVAPLSNVRVIDTISSEDIVINTRSFTYQPYSITYGSTTSVIEWRFDAFAIGQMNDLSYTVTMRNPVPGEDRLVDHKLEILYTDSNGNSVRNEIGPLSVHVLSSVLDTSLFIDKSQYQAQSDVGINVQMENRSGAVWSGTVDVLIEDATGNVISHAATMAVSDLKPMGPSGWAYRLPVLVTAPQIIRDAVVKAKVDFASIMQTLGIAGKTIDKNSIRVLEIDALGNVLSESQAQATFTSDTLATIAWLLQGTTTKGTSRNFLIYFDMTDHNPKTHSLNTKLPTPPVRLIAYSDDIGRVFVAVSNGDGTFGTARLITDVTPASDNTWGVALDDFNNDGFADIITGSGATGDIYYLQNKADGSNTFNSGVKIGTINASAYIMGIAAADFDNDGNKDFVVSGNNNILYMFRGRGDGTFTQTILASPPGASNLRGKAVGDVDKDGKLDLVVTSYANGAIYFYKGNGDGTFASPIQIGANGSDPYGLIVGDFDENGVIDIIQSADNNGNAYLIKGHGDGTFEAPVLVPSLNPNNYTAFTVGDFNNDGHLDVIAVTLYNHTLEFYPGNGDGTFGPKNTIGATLSYTLGISSSSALLEVLPVLGVPETVPSQTFNFIWNTGSTIAGSYQVHAVWSDGTKTVSENRASFAILPDTKTAARIVTDKASYNPNETATLISTVTSKSVNYVMESLTEKISIQHPVDGIQLYTETKPIPTLMMGASFTFKSYWNTGTYPPGNYPVTLEVKDAAGALITTGTTTVTITNVITPSVALKGSISVDKQSILTGETVNASYSATNIGNVDLQNVTLSVLIVHVVAQTVYDTLTNQTSLVKSASYANMGQINTTNYTAMDYLVILRANIAGTEETLAGTYFRVEGAPSAPSLASPAMNADVETFTPILSVNNASDPNDDKLTYEFELYSDSGLTSLITSSHSIPEMNGVTDWTASLSLTENQTYFWRSRAYDGKLYGAWMSPALFRVNTINDPPTAPTIASPMDGTSVATFTPVLTINNATDPDSPSLTYNFDVALDPGFTQMITTIKGIFPTADITSWQVPVGLTENTWYYWRAQADDWLITGPWSTTTRFFVNTTNEAPTTPVIITPTNNATVPSLSTDITITNSTDSDSPVITDFFELDTTATFDSPNIIRSGGVAQGQGTTTWHVTGLKEDTQYYVRAKASDGQADSAWSNPVGFFVNVINEPPTTPTLANPSNGAGVTVLTPTLSIHDATDPDRDVLTYDFEFYSDTALTNLVSGARGQGTVWTVPITLTENQIYYWRARAFDGILASGWMPAASFMVNTANDAPGAPALSSPVDGSSVATLNPTLSVTNAMDPDSTTLTYSFEVYSGTALVTSITNVPAGSSGITSITLSTALQDNTVYQWRARAYDGDQYGPWMAMASFTVHVSQMNVNATINFDPNTLNKTSNGTWVVVYIELPAGYKAADIVVSSIRLEGTIPAESRPSAVGDQDKDGIPDLMVKFKRSDVINLLPNGDHVPVHVTGQVGSATFDGVDIIRVMK